VIITAQLDLRGRSTWDTGVLTAETFHWPTDAPVLRLSELMTPVAASSVVKTGAQVVTPASLDPETGAVRRRSQRYQGSVFQVGRDLQFNDLIIPTVAEVPVLLVTQHLRGALVSSRFSALRSTGDVTAIWVWAVLNSKSGRDLRLRLSLGSLDVGGVRGSLLDLPLPVPPLARQLELEPALRAIESSTHTEEEEEAPSTWWRTTQLRGHEWRLLLAAPDPERLDDGEPLASFAEKIEYGHVRDRNDDTDQPGAGVPVTDIGVLSGRPPKRWVRPLSRSATMSTPGDVLVAALGARAHATVATEMTVIDRHVIRIQLKNSRQAAAIAHYLNGTAGYGLRQMLLRGTVPYFSIADLSRIPVPADVLAYESAFGSVVPLALQLENALWRS
jgi:hypothetical protein